MQLSYLRLPAAYLLVAGLFLWPLVLHPAEVPVRLGGQESDLLLSHLPNADYLRWSLATYGQWPLWNAQILAGQPFAANPLSGFWYPPNLLLALPFLTLPVVFNLLLWVHVAFAGWGVYQLLRREGLPAGPAFFGGLAFAGTPKLIAHIGAGHVLLVFAVAWTPWLLLAAQQLAQRPSPRVATLVGLSLAAMFLADARWPIYAGLLATAYGLAGWLAERRNRLHAPLARTLAYAGLAILLCLLLSAGLIIPLIELVQHADRGTLTAAETSAYSLPPWPYLLGLVVPLPGVIHEWVTYAGLAPLLLALMGALRRPLWLSVAVLAALFALGSYGPLYPVLSWLPGLNLLRVPPRAWFLVALAVCVLAAHGLNKLLGWLAQRPRWQRFAQLALPALLLITGADLLAANASLLTTRPMPTPSPAADWLAAQPGIFRVYSSSGSLPLPDRLQHVEGVDPLHLSALAAYVQRATNIGDGSYSVSVPAEFSRDAATPTPDAALLGTLNVRYFAAEFDIDAPELTLVQQFGDTRIYENSLVRPRVWLSEGGTAKLTDWSPDRLVVQANGPGTLVLSEVAYPGWQARVNGRRVALETVEGLLRAVPVGAGVQEVELYYRPLSVLIGGLLTLVGVTVVLGVWRWTK